MPLRRSAVADVQWGAAVAITGMLFPSNPDAGGDIRLVWDGSAFLSRTDHSALWAASYVQQNGFYAVAWHSPLTYSWDSGVYSYGTHPYPAADGTVNGNGDALTGSGFSGAVHFWEIAGIANGGSPRDTLCSPGGGGGVNISPFIGTFARQARTCATVTTNLRHRFYHDVVGNVSNLNQQTITVASIGSPSAPAFYFGASDWERNVPSSGRNDETPSCTLRAIMLFNTELNSTHLSALSLLNTDAQVLAYCSANGLTSNLWYLCMNPTPTDVTDKSGNAHHPRWDTANRPTLVTF